MLTDRLLLGGGLEYIYQIARDQKENEFVVMANGGEDGGKLLSLPNVTIDSHGYGMTRIMQYRPEVIHCNHLRPLLSLLGMPLRKIPVPVINTIHGIHVRKYGFSRSLKNVLARRLRHALERYLFRRADINITLNKDDDDFVRRLYGIKNTCLIPNGIDFAQLNAISKNRQEQKKELKVENYDHIFMVIARFDFPKGYDILLEAIRLAQQQLRAANAGFVLIGDGPMFADMVNMAARHQITDLIRFCGAIPDAWKNIPAADCLLLPSRWEGLPLVLLEAGYLNVPVIGSDAPGIATVLTDGVSGTLFENCDSADLARVLVDFCNGGQHSQQQVKLHEIVVNNYNVRQMSEKLRNLYRTMITA